MNPQPAEIHAWEVTIRGHNNRMAALAMVIWDYLITLEDERELFWKRKWTFATFLFLWSRYLGIFLIIFGVSVAVSPNLTDSLCYLWLRVESWVGMSTLCSIQVILQLRIYALYDGSPKVTALIISVFFMEVICAVAMFGFTSANIRVVAEAMGDMVRCKVTAVPSWLWLFWVAVTSFELLLCVLALYKGYQRIRISGLFKSQQVLQDILLRDSVLFYVAIQGVYIFNLVFWIQDPKDSLDVLTGMAVAVPCVMCGRLMINVRQALPHRDTLISPSDISLGQI